MSTQDTLSPVPYPLFSAAIGAISKLRLVCAAIGPIQVPSGQGRQTGTIFVANTVEFDGGPQTSETGLEADYPLLPGNLDTTVTYTLKEHKHYDRVLDRHERWNQGTGPLALKAGVRIGRKLGKDMERALATVLFSTSNFNNSAVVDLGGGGVQWSTFSTAKPDLDIKKALIAFREQSEVDATHIVIGRQALDAYASCLYSMDVQVVTSGGATGQALTEEAAVQRIERLHNVKVLVGAERYNSAAPGLSKSGAYIWGKGFWVGCLGDVENASMTDAGLSLDARAVAVVVDAEAGSASGLDMSGAALPINIEANAQLPPKAKATIVSGEAYWDVVLCKAELGYYVTAVVA
jgi:hypothetical protein